MGQVLTADNLPDLAIASSTTVTMGTTYLGKNTRITIGGNQYLYSSLITLNFGTTGINGLDTGSIAANTLYYIYAVQSSGTPGLVASLAAPATGPAGFTAWKEVGRCRTLLTAATLATITNRIGGASSLTLSGTEWSQISTTVKGVSSDPTFSSSGSPTTPRIEFRRVLDTYELTFMISQNNNTGTATGSGLYYFLVPNNLNMDYTKFVATTGSLNIIKGNGNLRNVTSIYEAYFQIDLDSGNKGRIAVIYNVAGVHTQWGSVNSPATQATLVVQISGAVPISEFSGLYI